MAGLLESRHGKLKACSTLQASCKSVRKVQIRTLQLGVLDSSFADSN
jgi:hypothetical protein